MGLSVNTVFVPSMQGRDNPQNFGFYKARPDALWDYLFLFVNFILGRFIFGFMLTTVAVRTATYHNGPGCSYPALCFLSGYGRFPSVMANGIMLIFQRLHSSCNNPLFRAHIVIHFGIYSHDTCSSRSTSSADFLPVGEGLTAR